MTVALDSIGRRVAFHRTVAGLTQQGLSERTGLSLSTIRQVERDELVVRLETLHRIAQVLRVRTATLAGDRGDREPANPEVVRLWKPVLKVLAGGRDPVGEPATPAGVLAVLDAAQSAWERGLYGDALVLLPALIRDAASLAADGRQERCQVLTLVAWLLVHTHQYDQATMVLGWAVDDAVDREDLAAVKHVESWLHLRSGQLGDSQRTAVAWAERIEPKMSQATVGELATWGWSLIRVATTAIRDNQPGVAADAMRLAETAATAIGPRQVFADGDQRRPFGHGVVLAKRAELAVIADQPDQVLKLAAKIPPKLVALTSPNWGRHLLDVAWAHGRLGRVDEALTVFERLQAAAPQWLAEQRAGRDAFVLLVPSGRKMPARMRAVATAIRWSDN